MGMISANFLLILSGHTSTWVNKHHSSAQPPEKDRVVCAGVLKPHFVVVVVVAAAELERPFLNEPPANRVRSCFKPCTCF